MSKSDMQNDTQSVPVSATKYRNFLLSELGSWKENLYKVWQATFPYICMHICNKYSNYSFLINIYFKDLWDAWNE